MSIFFTTLPLSRKRPITEDDDTTLPPPAKRLKAGNDTESDSDSEMSFSSDSTDEAGSPGLDEAGSLKLATAEGTMWIFPFDREYIHPDDCVETSVSVEREEEEERLDYQAEHELIMYEQGVRAERKELLEQLDVIASVRGLEKMDDLIATMHEQGVRADGKELLKQLDVIASVRGLKISDSKDDSEGDSEGVYKDWSKPDPVGWESAANGSRLHPRAIGLMLDFFKDWEHLDRAECEEYYLKAYLEGVGPYEARERPLNVHAYPSECQFPNSYMVEIIDTAVTSPTLMTQFYITHETVDEDQLARAKGAYGNFVPQYTYVGNMGLAPNYPELFVWRIVSRAGRPLLASCSRLGLRDNQDKYVGILKQFVDFVCEPLLRLAGGGNCLSDGQDWPMVLNNTCLDVYNIMIRPDWPGIACVLLWTKPLVMTLPFGASLDGLLFLEGKPDTDPGVDGNPICEADPSRFKSYSREGRELQRLCMYYLREKIPVLTNDPQPWHRLFAAMAQGVATAAECTELGYKCYARQLDELTWDWFHFEMDPGAPEVSVVACAESGCGGGDGDVGMG
ncbi:hypothetical protein GGTG_04482 [Gaeumannomyces tritici R3-111a-1]|uniref:Uncharacterized protein n=1 Tax=Gaeumannomyces tritici (strain R3-111a-1) TaxID=644352 RepID=J3NT83_GAET3|nr:hypothetical protein GGTG_04482 [Gaeumannomyces tritici R3-111a-1]EJT79398.1 hypothetical protein GGTG_04482 [Gaeumannomyces tritici R3-111a-1]